MRQKSERFMENQAAKCHGGQETVEESSGQLYNHISEGSNRLSFLVWQLRDDIYESSFSRILERKGYYNW